MRPGSPPIEERPGTLLDHDHTEKVYVMRNGNRIETGTLDRRQRVYQMMLAGFWKERCYVASIEELQAVAGRAD